MLGGAGKLRGCAPGVSSWADMPEEARAEHAMHTTSAQMERRQATRLCSAPSVRLQLPLLLTKRRQLARKRLQAGLRLGPLGVALCLLSSCLLSRTAGLAALGRHAGSGSHSSAQSGTAQDGQSSDIPGSSRCLDAISSGAGSCSRCSLQRNTTWRYCSDAQTSMCEANGRATQAGKQAGTAPRQQQGAWRNSRFSHLLASHRRDTRCR